MNSLIYLWRHQFSNDSLCNHCFRGVVINGYVLLWFLAGEKKVRLEGKIIKILEFFILSVEKLFKEKLEDLKNIGKMF